MYYKVKQIDILGKWRSTPVGVLWWDEWVWNLWWEEECLQAVVNWGECDGKLAVDISGATVAGNNVFSKGHGVKSGVSEI
jgi:hypothetical protein